MIRTVIEELRVREVYRVQEVEAEVVLVKAAEVVIMTAILKLAECKPPCPPTTLFL